MIKEAIEAPGGLEKLIEPDRIVLIKPNVGFSEKDAVTIPEVLAAIVREAKKLEPRKILIAESSVRGSDTSYNYEATGISTVARKLGVDLINLKRESKYVYVSIDGIVLKRVKVYKLAYDADVIICVPKLKRHVEAGVTISLT